MMIMSKKTLALILIILINSCAVGPKYQPPTPIDLSLDFKESGIIWQHAKPSADAVRGNWWEIFDDPTLDQLMNQVQINNQNIIAAKKNYEQSNFLAQQAKASFFPSVELNQSVNKNKTTIYNRTTKTTSYSKTHSAGLNASWEPDLWGSIAYNYQSNKVNAESNKINIASTMLSTQSSLAQYYFEVRNLEADQKLLDNIVLSNKKSLDYTQNRLKEGIMNQADLIAAQNNYHSSLVVATNNKINLGTYIHAIAVLLGKSPSHFTLPDGEFKYTVVQVPKLLPSQLLERRPDIAIAEKAVEAANVQVGLARTAFFPNITLSATPGYQGNGINKLLSLPDFVWSVGSQMTMSLIDFGANIAKNKAAKAAYESSIASYRQTVLSAMQNVEDQLLNVNNQTEQLQMQEKIVQNEKNNLIFNQNQYKQGIIDSLQIYNSQINYYNAQKTLYDMQGLKRTAEISLIIALGGGWKKS